MANTKSKKKKCFVITPIGSETDKIRRHIDGIIDASIKPALEPDYKINVAHKISITGSITKQIINEIYCSDLVIANLTNKNPNVMYELAFRHYLGKPVIMIAEKGTDLPFDLISERTIFYENDAKGVLELKDELIKFEKTIDSEKVTSPIHELLEMINRDESIIKITNQQDSSSDVNAFQYIIDRLDRIESIIPNKSKENDEEFLDWEIVIYFTGHLNDSDLSKLKESLTDTFNEYSTDLVYLINNKEMNTLEIGITCPIESSIGTFEYLVEKELQSFNIKIKKIESF